MKQEQIYQLVTAIEKISHGNETPMGLEGVAMALGGMGTPGQNTSVAHSLTDIADAIRYLADTLSNLKQQP
jgi:hypothetical protein